MKHKIVIYTSSHLRTKSETVCIANAISKALGDLGID
jgi:folylpolyglutamate synthase/dihydropteroate synthase